MALIPVIALLGSVLLWGLLPFILLAIWGLYFALQRNYRARLISEELTLDPTSATLVRKDPGGQTRNWRCNRHWVTLKRYAKDGPVPHYITLRGEGREVEIGAFLSEEERIELYHELDRALRPAR